RRRGDHELHQRAVRSRRLPAAGSAAHDRDEQGFLGSPRTEIPCEDGRGVFPESSDDEGGRPVMNGFNRRRVLRGMVGGSAVTVALPLLNVFLNGNGDALADGKPMPIRFGTWYWGLGMAKSIFVPKTTGANWEITEELESLKGV